MFKGQNHVYSGMYPVLLHALCFSFYTFLYLAVFSNGPPVMKAVCRHFSTLTLFSNPYSLNCYVHARCFGVLATINPILTHLNI